MVLVTKSIMTERPNFLIIVADDLGFTDLSAFGGEIHTPNLQKLAENGVRFTDFHTASACSPTRSMLLSGTDNHIAGLGQMAEFMYRKPEIFHGQSGYEGYLNDRVAALPELLQDEGYFTFISGKWHLGLLPEYWPVKRGFEKSFTLLPGAGNHFKYNAKDENGQPLKFIPPMFAEGDRKVDHEKELPEDFYSTNFYTDKGLEFLDYDDDRPFFGCLTYTAPHWPYQAPREVIDKYKGKYDDGPEESRRRRLKQALKAGIIPDGVEPHKMTSHKDKRWKDLTIHEQQIESRIMETYAAMVEILDTNVGRVIDKLKSKGKLDNTFILFMSDNGAEGMLMEAMPLRVVSIRETVLKYYNNSLENIGNEDSWVYYGDQWAQAATAPSYMYKMWASEGGIRCPLIIHYPKLHENAIDKVAAGSISREFTTVMDILPTVLELAGVKHPGNFYKGREVAEPRGKSWVTHLSHSTPVHSEDTVTGWELFGQQAIRKGPYKALYIPIPYGPGEWQLFNIRKDPGETKDLAALHPGILKEMLDHWAEYVSETGLIELGSEFLDVGEDGINYITCESDSEPEPEPQKEVGQ
ncbi:hypothetical protein CAAN1_04S02652 [[Candida] anglica]|uniref:Sulfatase N-terminal domain-containing protein n=1 Tax=[Candida] anglica TaxID=148631 RepID=A0ABP0E909_9ASCO